MMRRYYSLVLIGLLMNYCSFAQMRKEDKWGCSFAINSIQAQIEVPLLTAGGAILVDADGNIIAGGKRTDKSYSISIIPKYHINDDVLLRFEFGLTALNLDAQSDQIGPIEHYLFFTNVSEKIYRYAIGFQWNFLKNQRVESYCGIHAIYSSYSSLHADEFSEHREMKTDTLKSSESANTEIPEGIALGVGALAGFNLYFNKHLSLGAELSSSALYYKFGGASITNGEELSLPTISNHYTSLATNSYKGFRVSKIISSFNLTIWFK